MELQTSDKAIEIVDKSSHEPIFQMIRRSAGTIQINGVLGTGQRDSDGADLLLWASEETDWTFSAKSPANFKLKRIFKYPAWKYPHEYEEGSFSSQPPSADTSREAIARATPRPSQSCPNGICIGGDNNGTAIVNNFGPPLPRVTWILDPTAVKQDAVHPQTCITISIDRTFLDAKFAVVCDRKCKAVSGSAAGKHGGYFQSDWGTIPDHPEVAAFVVNGPNPMPADDTYKGCVESDDSQPVGIIDVKTLTISPK